MEQRPRRREGLLGGDVGYRPNGRYSELTSTPVVGQKLSISPVPANGRFVDCSQSRSRGYPAQALHGNVYFEGGANLRRN